MGGSSNRDWSPAERGNIGRVNTESVKVGLRDAIPVIVDGVAGVVAVDSVIPEDANQVLIALWDGNASASIG